MYNRFNHIFLVFIFREDWITKYINWLSSIYVFGYFPFGFWGQDMGSDCISSWSLLIFLLFSFLWKDTGSHRYKRIVTEALLFFINPQNPEFRLLRRRNLGRQSELIMNGKVLYGFIWNLENILKLYQIYTQTVSFMAYCKKLVWFRVHSPKYSWVLATPFSGRVLGLHCNRNDVTCQSWMLDSFVV